jgi:hypothetical protein
VLYNKIKKGANNMFNNTKINQLGNLLNIKDIELLEIALKKQAKYLKVNSTFLLKSFIVMVDIKKQHEEEQLKNDRYTSKNILINKYKNTIIDLYTIERFGYLKISKYLAITHNAVVSKSSIENFIKNNNITRD